MALKIYLSPSSQEANSYAAEGTNEERQCNRIAEAAKVALERNGYTVKKAPEGQSYQKNTQESNAWGADIHMPIHTNAGGSSKGTLALCYSGNTDDKYVKNVYAAVAELTPWSDSGIKVRSDLYEINNTKATCVYMEMAFHDKSDSAQWIIDNVVALGEAIAKGMCAADGKKYIAGDGTEVIPPKNESTPSSGSTSSGSGYDGNSIVDYLKSIGKDSSFSARKQYADQYGISNYTGTAEQNLKLLDAMRGKGTSSESETYYPKFSSSSIVDGLKSIGVDSSMSNRKAIAQANGISNYEGTASQNTTLCNLAKQGKLKKAGTGIYSETSYYKAFNSTSIVDGLKSIGVDSSFANRKKIAAANGISGYSGTASQNNQLCTLAKAGKLKKA